MTQRSSHLVWWPVVVALAAALFLTAPVRSQQPTSAADDQQAKSAAGGTKSGPVIRTYGAKGGYRTEVTSETKGTLSQEDRQQVALLSAQVFQHIDEARQAIDTDDLKAARKEVDKGRQAIQAIRLLLPRTSVHTRTTAPDGKLLYDDQREVQEDRVQLFEGMLSTKTIAPIVTAKQNAADNASSQESSEVAGVRLVSSETITTQVFADLNVVEGQLGRAAKALEQNKAEDAAKALAEAQVRGVEFRHNKEDTPLAAARDAMWLAKRALEENNPTQAQINLSVARRSLRLYRELAPKERCQEVDQMLKEADELGAKLRQETAQHPASSGERTQQGLAANRWWERINEWFRRR
jgi:YfdX protein